MRTGAIAGFRYLRWSNRNLWLFDPKKKIGPFIEIEFSTKRGLASLPALLAFYAEGISRPLTVLVLCVALVAKNTLISAKQSCRTVIVCSQCLS